MMWINFWRRSFNPVWLTMQKCTQGDRQTRSTAISSLHSVSLGDESLSVRGCEVLSHFYGCMFARCGLQSRWWNLCPTSSSSSFWMTFCTWMKQSRCRTVATDIRRTPSTCSCLHSETKWWWTCLNWKRSTTLPITNDLWAAPYSLVNWRQACGLKMAM